MRSRCDRTRALLPRLVDGTLSRPRQRLVRRHVDHCDGCAAELERQRVVASQLERLREVEQSAADAAPPEGLLDALLEQAADPGLRARAAVPARAAVSGARPELSVAFAAGAIALAVLAGWAGWRLGTAVAEARAARAARASRRGPAS